MFLERFSSFAFYAFPVMLCNEVVKYLISIVNWGMNLCVFSKGSRNWSERSTTGEISPHTQSFGRSAPVSASHKFHHYNCLVSFVTDSRNHPKSGVVCVGERETKTSLIFASGSRRKSDSNPRNKKCFLSGIGERSRKFPSGGVVANDVWVV